VSIFTRPFWKDTAERTISSAAQGVVLGLGAAQFTDVGNVVSLSEAAGLLGLGAGLLTFFKCLAASRVGDPSSASLVDVSIPTEVAK
jgi:hypothetical protein